MAIPLDRYDQLPERLTEISPREVRSVFPNPSLISLEGRRQPPVFLSTLLHGNETTSFGVLQALARRYRAASPERSLLIFVGNVAAAEEGVRHREGEPDFNRIWSGVDGEHGALAERVLGIAREAEPFASIDVHNNTGSNPLYGCVNILRPADLQLAARFAPLGVYYRNPPTTQSIAFSRLCPAVTLECGRSDDADGLAAAIDLVEYALSLEEFDLHPPAPEALTLYETVGRVVVDPEASVSFGEAGADLILRPDLESTNFRMLKAGDDWARLGGPGLPFRVVDEHGEDHTRIFFRIEGPRVSLNRDAVPAMVTPDQTIIHQDCLCYLMRPLESTSKAATAGQERSRGFEQTEGPRP